MIDDNLTYKSLNDLLVEGLLKIPSLESQLEEFNKIFVLAIMLLKAFELKLFNDYLDFILINELLIEVL